MKKFLLTMTSVDGEILQILINCGCAQYALIFRGMSIDKFFAYNRDDLGKTLPANVGQKVIKKIGEEIQKAKALKEKQQDVVDDDVEFLEVVKGTSVKVKEELNIDDDNDGSSSLAAVEENESSDDSSNDDDGSEPIVLNPKSPKQGFQKLEEDKRALVLISGQKEAHKCDEDHPTAGMLKKWADGLTKWGYHIHTLRMPMSTWKPLKSSCPWNMFKILTEQCPLIQELSIEGQIQSGNQIPRFPLNFRLPLLTALIIHHKGDLTYKNQLKQIILAAANLREMYFGYGSHTAINSFLTMLKNFEADQIKNLKFLSIKSFHESGYLTEAQIVMLTKVKANSLEELDLGNGLFEDVKGSTLENLLDQFKSSLKSFSLLGCFQGMNETKPEILINIPNMDKLKYMDFGGQYVYESIFEDAHPPKKIRKGSRGQRIINWDNLEMKPFPVTLKFPILPNLEQLDVGSLFSIRELHFANFPKLEKFYVSSRWDLSVIFPPEEKSRRTSYPLLNGLQLPDHLDDPNFVKMIPQRFPNLECCIINLATVKVLRTFFSVMADSKLEGLNLCTQFDFRSTMDICLLDKPSRVSLGEDEVKKIRLLKKYERWEEFVKFYNIQLPPYDLSSLEEEGLAGLAALKNLKDLELTHHQRILKIPMGHLHWTDPKCEFTREIIGFKWYPWSIACENMRNKLMTKTLENDAYLNFDNRFRATKQPKFLGKAFKIQHSAVTAEVKSEGRKLIGMTITNNC